MKALLFCLISLSLSVTQIFAENFQPKTWEELTMAEPSQYSTKHLKYLREQALADLKTFSEKKEASVADKKAILKENLMSPKRLCAQLSSFYSSLNADAAKECGETMDLFSEVFAAQMLEMSDQEIIDVFQVTYSALQKASQGVIVTPEMQMEEFQKTKSFELQLAELPEEDRKQVEAAFRMQKDPDFQKAKKVFEESGETKLLEALMKKYEIN